MHMVTLLASKLGKRCCHSPRTFYSRPSVATGKLPSLPSQPCLHPQSPLSVLMLPPFPLRRLRHLLCASWNFSPSTFKHCPHTSFPLAPWLTFPLDLDIPPAPPHLPGTLPFPTPLCAVSVSLNKGFFKNYFSCLFSL